MGLILDSPGKMIRVYRGEARVETSAAATLARYKEAAARDVCGDDRLFSAEGCVAALLKQSASTLICDAVLDQDVLPGAGNIIKVLPYLQIIVIVE